LRFKLLDLASILPILALKSSFSACWIRSLGGGRDFRGFRGRGRPNHGDSPKLAGEGSIRGRFSGRERGRSWGRDMGQGNDNYRLTQDAAVGQCWDRENQRRKLTPFLPSEEQSASNLPPSPTPATKTTSQCYPGGCRFNPNTTAAHQAPWPKPMTPMSTRSNRTVTNPKLRITTGRTIFSYPAIPK